MSAPAPFHIKNCALSTIATGIYASSLPEFTAKLLEVPLNCIYYHFWGGSLRYTFKQSIFQNDFSKWAFATLHDPVLAEKWSIINPTDFVELEDLRRAVIDIAEDHLDEFDLLIWRRLEYKFHFLRSIMVVFNTEWKATTIQELKKILPYFSPGSIYYHFIDARRRTEGGLDDFSEWIKSFNSHQFASLLQEIASVDPYFLSLTEIQERIIALFNKHIPENL